MALGNCRCGGMLLTRGETVTCSTCGLPAGGGLPAAPTAPAPVPSLKAAVNEALTVANGDEYRPGRGRRREG